MPIIYLSPSTQENNYYVSGGTEEQYMNLIADAMVHYLPASGIQYVRNTPSMSAASSIAASNADVYKRQVSGSGRRPNLSSGRISVHSFPEGHSK